jgi:hypothetical protein
MGGRSGQSVLRNTAQNRPDSGPDASTTQRTIDNLKERAARSLANENTGMRVPSNDEISTASENVRIERGILTDEQGEYSVYFAIDNRTGNPIESAGLIVDGERRDFEINESAQQTYNASEITNRNTR